MQIYSEGVSKLQNRDLGKAIKRQRVLHFLGHTFSSRNEGAQEGGWIAQQRRKLDQKHDSRSLQAAPRPQCQRSSSAAEQQQQSSAAPEQQQLSTAPEQQLSVAAAQHSSSVQQQQQSSSTEQQLSIAAAAAQLSSAQHSTAAAQQQSPDILWLRCGVQQPLPPQPQARVSAGADLGINHRHWRSLYIATFLSQMQGHFFFPPVQE